MACPVVAAKRSVTRIGFLSISKTISVSLISSPLTVPPVTHNKELFRTTLWDLNRPCHNFLDNVEAVASRKKNLFWISILF